MMKFVRSALMLALAAATGGVFAQQITLKVHHFWPGQALPPTKILQPWCDKIAAESNNRMKCQVFPAMQLGGNPAQLIDQVRDGVVDIATRGGFLDMAVAHLRRGLEVFPDDVQLQQYLARNLSTLGRWEEAIAQWDALIARQPADAIARLGRVQTLLAAGQPERAIADTLALLEQEPGNSVFAYYNALAHGQTPAHQPPELSQELFDGMAEVYDLHVVRRLGYYLPREVAQQIKALHPEGEYHVLDLGCGTGLLGLYLGRIEGFLIGVDCSRQMVQQAKRHGVYDRFHTVNLHDALAETPDALYHVITALDVFIYAGALDQAIPNAHRILRPGGHFIFSCETAPEGGAELVLQTNGRYAHRRDHVEQLCRNAGFVRVDVEDVVLRKENDQPVHGFVITAHKAA